MSAKQLSSYQRDFNIRLSKQLKRKCFKDSGTNRHWVHIMCLIYLHIHIQIAT